MMTTPLTSDERLKLREYADAKLTARELEARIKDLKPAVLAALTRVHAEDTPVQAPEGVLSLRPRRKWTYSPELEAEMERVKKAQKFEEATGAATFETQYDVYFK
jgi:hypothetical protein